MANSIPDVNLSGDWVDVYAATGIPVGTEIWLQNKSSTPTLIYIKATKPTDPDDGYAMVQFETIYIDPNETGVWAKGNGPLHIQLS